MKRHAATLVLLALPAAAPALTISFDFRYDSHGFFAAPETRAVLEAAAAAYAGISDTLTAIEPGAGDHWSLRLMHPSLAGPPVTVNDLTIAANSITVFVGASTTEPGVLGFANTGISVSAQGSAAFVDAVTTRGQANTEGAAATDYATWGGMIWLNAGNNWHLGLDAPPAGSNDLYTTLVHELGHILGFGEAASWAAQVDTQGKFIGANASALYGGAVPLDRYGVHWASGIWPGLLMDPSTAAGTRETLTALDLAGFADIGWQVSAVPEPSAAWMGGSGLLLLMAALRRQRAAKRCVANNSPSSDSAAA